MIRNDNEAVLFGQYIVFYALAEENYNPILVILGDSFKYILIRYEITETKEIFLNLK